MLGFLRSLFKGSPATSPTPPGAPRWHQLALKEVGFHEKGNNLGIERYISMAKCGHLGDPWCAIFVNAMLQLAGVAGSRSPAARSFETNPNFVKLNGPAIGAVTTMWRGSKGSGLGHVYFYAGHSAGGASVLGLGGNQDDQVCLQWEPENRITGYWWPKLQPLPKTGVVFVNSEAKTTSKET